MDTPRMYREQIWADVGDGMGTRMLVVPAQKFGELERELAQANDDRKRAMRLAFELTPDCQTAEEAVAALADLVRLARTQRDEATARAESAERELATLRQVKAGQQAEPKIVGYWRDDGFFGEFTIPTSGAIPEHGWLPVAVVSAAPAAPESK